MFGRSSAAREDAPPRDAMPSDAVGTAAELQLVQQEVAQLQDRLARFGGKLDEMVEQGKRLPLQGIASVIQQAFADRPESELYEALFGGSNSVRGAAAPIGLGSSVCKQLHFSLDEFRYWTNAMGRRPRMHRKEWEWFYIAQALFERGLLQAGKKGLVFAAGQEPLPSLFASLGCSILATDQAPESAVSSGWAGSGMYSSEVETLHHATVIDKQNFLSLVDFRHADMNAIPEQFNGCFDFCWSSCSFEHLGSIEHGLAFVVNSIDTLVPGGVAVHTTEFNLQSNESTWETPGNSLYRRRDIEELVRRLTDRGHKVEPIDWAMGGGVAETVCDLPPYRQSPHLKLSIAGYACTSIGLIITRGSA